MADRLEKLLQMYEQDPNDAFGTYAIAMELAKRTDSTAALAWLDKTLELDADHAYACYQQARLLSELGRADEARQAIVRGLEAARRTGDAKAEKELSELQVAITH